MTQLVPQLRRKNDATTLQTRSYTYIKIGLRICVISEPATKMLQKPSSFHR